jgi:hypothetical protein
MTVGQGDILTTQKNGVVAINNLNKTIANVGLLLSSIPLANPTTMSPTVAAGTTAGQLVALGSGRLFGISIPTYTGASQIFVYDSATIAGIAATNLIFASLPSNTAGWMTYYNVNLVFGKGLVIKTDAGTTCAVSYNLAE